MLAPAAIACCAGLAALLAVSPRSARSASFGTVPWQHAMYRAQEARNTGKSEEARFQSLRAFAEARRLGKDHPFYTITLRHLSDINYYDLQFDVAKNYSLDELEILKGLGENYQDSVPVYIRLSEIAFMQGKLDESASYLTEARKLKDKSEFNPLLRAEIDARYSLLALVNHDRGKYQMFCKKAEDEWVKAVKEPKTGANMSEYGVELARLSRRSNKRVTPALRTAAEYYCTRGLSIITRNCGTNGLAFIHALNRVAETHGICNRPTEQLACWKRVLETCRNTKELTPVDKTNTLLPIARALVMGDRPYEALPFFDLSLHFSRLGRDPNLHAETLFQASDCYASLGRNAEAIALKRQLLDVLQSLGRKDAAARQKRQIDMLSSSSSKI